jgi:hypothetical protein
VDISREIGFAALVNLWPYTQAFQRGRPPPACSTKSESVRQATRGDDLACAPPARGTNDPLSAPPNMLALFIEAYPNAKTLKAVTLCMER